MRRQYLPLFFLTISVLLISCASETLKAPCPNYGKHCDQIPINSWDTTSV